MHKTKATWIKFVFAQKWISSLLTFFINGIRLCSCVFLYSLCLAHSIFSSLYCYFWIKITQRHSEETNILYKSCVFKRLSHCGRVYIKSHDLLTANKIEEFISREKYENLKGFPRNRILSFSKQFWINHAA